MNRCFRLTMISVFLLLLSGSALADKDSLISWYHKHYPFATMKDSIFTFETEFERPAGYMPLDSSQCTDYQNWVANWPLWHRWKSVGSFKANLRVETDSISRCLHLPYHGPRQRDCNIPVRIVAEWLYYQERQTDLKWTFELGDSLTYDGWLSGELRLDRLGQPLFVPAETRVGDDYEYYRFMFSCMDFNNFRSLAKNCQPLDSNLLAPGDLVLGYNSKGRDGMALIVVQVIVDKSGNRLYVVGTGCPEACDFHIPKLTENRDRPWLTLAQVLALTKSFEHSGTFRLLLP